MSTIFYYLLLIFIAILPVAGLLIMIYFMDRYQKEPIGSLLKAFFGGFLALGLDLIIVFLFLDYTIGLIPGFKGTDFYKSFIQAGIPEELCKFAIFMIFIWRDKNFDEYFDGIVYACFISLGFACVENIMYVVVHGVGTGIVRAMLSVPAHFLFGILMGYFLSLAKFEPKKRVKHIFTGLLLAMAAHGVFDWLIFKSNTLVLTGKETMILLSGLLYHLLLAGDVLLWIFGMKLVRKHLERSRQQAEEALNLTTNLTQNDHVS